MKYIIGLGDSWTQGEGGYPDHIWKQYNGRVQQSLRGQCDYHVRQFEHQNSWVNQLVCNHFPDYIPVNLGVKGIGNRAAFNQLYFTDIVNFRDSEGIIIFMLSGIDRYDFFNKEMHPNDVLKPDMYSNGIVSHYKYTTMWPYASKNELWTMYGKHLWSDQFVSYETMMNLLNAQNFAKAHNFKLVVASAFNPIVQGLDKYLLEHTNKTLYNKFDWSCYLHSTTAYVAMVEKLVEVDNLLPKDKWTDFFDFYHSRDYPSTYLTNCEGTHPTIEGYKVIADELATFIKYKNYA